MRDLSAFTDITQRHFIAHITRAFRRVVKDKPSHDVQITVTKTFYEGFGRVRSATLNAYRGTARPDAPVEWTLTLYFSPRGNHFWHLAKFNGVSLVKNLSQDKSATFSGAASVHAAAVNFMVRKSLLPKHLQDSAMNSGFIARSTYFSDFLVSERFISGAYERPEDEDADLLLVPEAIDQGISAEQDEQFAI
ncbi:hypothetical protein [Burkholderia gladioli]|uniref:hypothetical protein n=1 Tax=Burkholderia gladioli TaxID=28095 RepID=UPI00163E6BBE|nr:hypothetical protein [Burkholderia gladioli]